MDKDHLIELISNSLLYESKDPESTSNLSDFKKLFTKIKSRSIKNYVKRIHTLVIH